MLRVSPRVVARDLRRAWVGGPDEPGVTIGVGDDGATRIRHEACDYTAIVRRANGGGASD
jgi:hypothetical protein